MNNYNRQAPSLILVALLCHTCFAATCTVAVYPPQPTTSDSVTLTVTCGVGLTSCVPVYQDLSVLYEYAGCRWDTGCAPRDYYPPDRELIVDWAIVPPPRSTVCVDTPTAHGPTFSLPPLEPGRHIVIHDGRELGRFNVRHDTTGYLLCGCVSPLTDVYITRMPTDSNCTAPDSCYRDSLTTDSLAYYEFLGLSQGQYAVTFSREGHLTRGVVVDVDTHVVLSPRLVRTGTSIEGAASVWKADGPVEGCTVSVASGAVCTAETFSAVTDWTGWSTWLLAPHECGNGLFTVTADYPGFLSAMKVDSAFPFGKERFLVGFHLTRAHTAVHIASRSLDSTKYSLSIAAEVCSTGVPVAATYAVHNMGNTPRQLTLLQPCYTSPDMSYLSSVSTEFLEQDSSQVSAVVEQDAGPCSGCPLQIEVCPGDSFVTPLPAVAFYPQTDTMRYAAWLAGMKEDTYLSVSLPVANPSDVARPAAGPERTFAVKACGGGSLVVSSPREQAVTVRLAGINGRMVGPASRYVLCAGTHWLDMGDARGAGVRLVLVSGPDRRWIDVVPLVE